MQCAQWQQRTMSTEYNYNSAQWQQHTTTTAHNNNRTQRQQRKTTTEHNDNSAQCTTTTVHIPQWQHCTTTTVQNNNSTQVKLGNLVNLFFPPPPPVGKFSQVLPCSSIEGFPQPPRKLKIGTGCLKKNEPQFLPYCSGCEHPRRMRHISYEDFSWATAKICCSFWKMESKLWSYISRQPLIAQKWFNTWNERVDVSFHMRYVSFF